MRGSYQYRSFSYVTDAARIAIRLMSKDKAAGRVINVGNDQEHARISDICHQLSVIMGIDPEMIEHGGPDGSVDVRMPDRIISVKVMD